MSILCIASFLIHNSFPVITFKLLSDAKLMKHNTSLRVMYATVVQPCFWQAVLLPSSGPIRKFLQQIIIIK